MTRKGPTVRAELVADPVFQSTLITQLVNKVMLHGKKSTAEQIVYGALKLIEQKTSTEPLATVKRALDNVKPPLEVRSRRVGGATYQVPVEVKPRRSMTLAIRWVVDNSRGRREKTMAECLANELMDASNGVGASMKKREDMQKMAEANKAFAHYRW
ncbi:MAG: 30S ribosomal protein S7 [Ilumatobacteraceae bacterium]|jgi:small subunit ribosomal protein S7|nr:MAG: 30S ribosomal protein S7 [Acidimicrobium sp. BACL19 MAG-120924-bin39]MDA2955814.1 30S ribosomal protein S7 [Actinomycetota bacterium]MDP4641802.1 30S ribosomal protein S7 [Ilumatobacteraceae bacterium]MDP4834639.1 30S ribosomal protein S7 [Ilumatobacteraceae bacterium]MDP4930217.1 30S ribosomal protein S7 [Ilumatobacteraceae bacterium]